MLTWEHYRQWLQEQLKSSLPASSPAPAAGDWTTDSRKVQPGQWFVALRGENFDGHRFIATAMEKGATGFMAAVSEKNHLPDSLVKQGIFVEDTLRARQLTALGWRKELGGLSLCALTGSVGKTTCKQMLGSVLRHAGETLCPADNFNNEVGVPEVLLRLNPRHRFAVLEMGARKPGDIRELVDISHPDIVTCLNAENTHIEIFGSREALRQTKLEILMHRPPHAKSVVFADDPLLLKGAQSLDPSVLTFGRSPEADVRILKEVWGPEGSLNLSLLVREDVIDCHFSRGHEAWPVNAAAACAMALLAGIGTEAMKKGLAGFENIGGRFQVFEKNACTLIDDTYNASPASVESGLKTLARLFPETPKVVILGDMLELGSFSEEEHLKTGRLCVRLLTPLTLIAVGPQAKFIAEGAKDAGLNPDQAFCYQDVREMLGKHPSLPLPNGVIYAKGSRAMGLEKIINHYR